VCAKDSSSRRKDGGADDDCSFVHSNFDTIRSNNCVYAIAVYFVCVVLQLQLSCYRVLCCVGARGVGLLGFTCVCGCVGGGAHLAGAGAGGSNRAGVAVGSRAGAQRRDAYAPPIMTMIYKNAISIRHSKKNSFSSTTTQIHILIFI